MLKRSGRGHDPDGADATSLGELAIECPACPHPDRNLPPNWNSGGPQAYIGLFIIYRLKCLLITTLFIDTYILNSSQSMAISSYD
jgi:hypothetical protein